MANLQHMYWKKNSELWRHNICFDQLGMASSSFILLSFPMKGWLPVKQKKKKKSWKLCNVRKFIWNSLFLDFEWTKPAFISNLLSSQQVWTGSDLTVHKCSMCWSVFPGQSPSLSKVQGHTQGRTMWRVCKPPASSSSQTLLGLLKMVPKLWPCCCVLSQAGAVVSLPGNFPYHRGFPHEWTYMPMSAMAAAGASAAPGHVWNRALPTTSTFTLLVSSS